MTETDQDLVRRELTYSTNSTGEPAAGQRVSVTLPEYADTNVHHMLFLPSDWQADWKTQHKTWPVIVEYTGNYYPAAGSTGKVEDAHLGFGISGGQFIWVTLPFVSEDHTKNAVTWWGDVDATVEYAKTTVPQICQQFGGDPKAVYLCGFSRGAIATNFIGLHDDEIAKLWCGFITHDHYDGEREWRNTTWGSPLEEYRKAAQQRLTRLNHRPALICQNGSTSNIKDYLSPRTSLESITFLDVNVTQILGKFPNNIAIHPHNDRWLIKDSQERQHVWAWVYDVLQKQEN